MKLEFLKNNPLVGGSENNNFETAFKYTSAQVDQLKHKASIDVKMWGSTVLSIVPWALNLRDKLPMPLTAKRESKKQLQPNGFIEESTTITTTTTARVSTLRFRPYVSKVPWHTGARAFLSQLFPRYGHYCGPNWSSGKDRGSLVWDKRPIDWLDFCCYCHDIGYDTYDQGKLLEADLAFLECLERPKMATKGDPDIASLYKTMCITGKFSTLNSVICCCLPDI